MRLSVKGYKRKVITLVFVLCLALSGCSGKEKETDKKQETQITGTAPGITGTIENTGNEGTVGNAGDIGNEGTVGNGGTDGSSGNSETSGDTLQGMTVLARADFDGDGTEDTICAEELDKSGLMENLCLVLNGESGVVSVKVPESITVTCYQESGTEFRISCDGLELGTTTLDEKPAYGALGKYMEKTMGMSKSGDSYKFILSAGEFSLADAECHGGSAVWCRGKFYVEGKEYAASWTQEYSLGEWVLTSMELPIWNVNGPTTGWGLGRGEMLETAKQRRYVGYLDEAPCYQDFHTLEDYDGDGTLDRIWRERRGEESYTIHFGNGKELRIIDNMIGDWFDCHVWKLNEDTGVLWCRESGSSTGGSWMNLHLFKQTEEGLVPMELPEGPTLTVEAVSERAIAFYWNGQNLDSLCLDEIYSFGALTVEEWLERHTTEQNGVYVLSLHYQNAIEMADGEILWESRIGDKFGGITFAWNTRYTDGAWETTAVYRR